MSYSYPDMYPASDSEPTVELTINALREIGYKYFGDYEMTDAQRDAVEYLAEFARRYLAAHREQADAIQSAYLKSRGM